MNQALALNTLSQIMDWDDDRARQEFDWLRLMARLKYDGYRDFQAGMRFIESLATWLQQFDKSERETAYAFVRNDLVYVGPSEMQRLVEQFYPRVVRDRILQTTASERHIPPYRVLADPGALAAAEDLRRKTLFMGLSDGARIDIVRHANVGILTNEQLVVATQVDADKWQDLLASLREELKDPEARFRLVYLIDDFVGTGTSFLRFDSVKQKWKGKLLKFKAAVDAANASLNGDNLFAPDWELCVHHYIGTAAAAVALEERQANAQIALAGEGWTQAVHFSYGTVLPTDLPIDAVVGRQDNFLALTRTYYDPAIRTAHTDVGGADHLGLGYGGCALPLVLDHNTPNNSVALLWAETDGGGVAPDATPAMRPLFRRRQRHA
ncbi:phosphoribosyltransferase-like protein [Caulobacter sp. LARHSG274]